jgi:hypothetical protein
MAISVPRSCVSSMTDMNPVLENSTPTRHGADDRWFRLRAPIVSFHPVFDPLFLIGSRW